MDAMSLLKDDHQKVKKLLAELESTTERGVKTREELFILVKEELVVHEAIEEEIFYPALKEHPKTKEIALEGYEEHHVVDTVMAEIEGVAYGDAGRVNEGAQRRSDEAAGRNEVGAPVYARGHDE